MRRNLQGVNVKTRKRNVAVPLDPAGFADSVLSLFEEHCTDVDGVVEKLVAANKALDTVNLDFSRYGVTLFEIYFSGARMGIGTKLVDDTKRKLDWHVCSLGNRAVGCVLPGCIRWLCRDLLLPGMVHGT